MPVSVRGRQRAVQGVSHGCWRAGAAGCALPGTLVGCGCIAPLALLLGAASHVARLRASCGIIEGIGRGSAAESEH